jgi:pilus assembly protein CpaB
VQVLKAVAQIEPGETLADASAAGKIELDDVPAEERLDGALVSIGESGGLVALSTIYPNEQVTTSKFGTPGEQQALTVPKGSFAISVNLSDTGRVAGFVSPGSEVALFLNGPIGRGEEGTRLLEPRVQVIAVAQTTMTTATTTTETGDQTTESLPRTLFTLAVDQDQAERILYASTHGELSFGLLDEDSKVKPGPGVSLSNLFG